MNFKIVQNYINSNTSTFVPNTSPQLQTLQSCRLMTAATQDPALSGTNISLLVQISHSHVDCAYSWEQHFHVSGILTIWVPHLTDKLHLWRPLRVFFGEVQVGLKVAPFTKQQLRGLAAHTSYSATSLNKHPNVRALLKQGYVIPTVSVHAMCSTVHPTQGQASVRGSLSMLAQWRWYRVGLWCGRQE